MGRIMFKVLNSNLEESLHMAKVPEANVIAVSERLKKENKHNFKLILIIMGIVAVMLGLTTFLSIKNTPSFQSQLPQWIGGYVALIAFLFVIVYIAFIGIIKFQFNNALKDGYPELYKEHKI